MVQHLFEQAHLLSPSFSAPSLRLAYKDLEQHRKIEEQKLKGLDGKKKEQAERLGMGLGVRRYDEEEEETAALRICVFISVTCFVFHWCCSSGVSHSVTSDMHIIQQENPYKSSKGRLFAGDDEDDGCIISRSV